MTSSMDAQREGRQTKTRTGSCMLTFWRKKFNGLPSPGPKALPARKKMAKKRKTPNQLEKKRQDNAERMSKFLQKKDEERALKDSLARQQALEQLGITKEFNYSDHAEIYSYADRTHTAPIETVDASIPPPEIPQYPERSPCPSPRPVRISDALTPTARTAVARFRRAKAILQAHFAK